MINDEIARERGYSCFTLFLKISSVYLRACAELRDYEEGIWSG